MTHSNQRTFLPYLNDDIFLAIVRDVLTSGTEALAQSECAFSKNVIDPFLMLFEMGSFNLDTSAWIHNEKTRQAQKTLSNKLGWFHQTLIGSLDDWNDLGTKELVDVVCHKRRVIAEIKNKYNTVKQSDLIGLYHDLAQLVQHKTQKYRDYTAYYVEIIPKKARRYNEYFMPPDRKTGNKAPADERIRKIDGASFYALATGVDDALACLFKALPCAIERVMAEKEPNKKAIEYEKVAQWFFRAYGNTSPEHD